MVRELVTSAREVKRVGGITNRCFLSRWRCVARWEVDPGASGCTYARPEAVNSITRPAGESWPQCHKGRLRDNVPRELLAVSFLWGYAAACRSAEGRFARW